MCSAGGVSWVRPSPSDLIDSARLFSTHGGLCTSLVHSLSQLASSNPGELITASPLIDVSAPDLSTGGQLVRPGAVPFVSCQAGAYGRLLLATHEPIHDQMFIILLFYRIARDYLTVLLCRLSRTCTGFSWKLWPDVYLHCIHFV